VSRSTEWKSFYEAAIIESDRAELGRRIRECEEALLYRLVELGGNPNYSAERLEIATALAALLRLKSDRLDWPVIRLDDGSIPGANSHTLSYDIFCGVTDGDAEWVETVRGFAAAVERMDTIATEKPGPYFVFDSRSRKVMVRSNSKYRHKPNAGDVD
jgi:hypothetical protein